MSDTPTSELPGDPLRARLVGAFAAPLDAALSSYARLVEALAHHDPNDPRADAQRHAACRAALQHVATLLKLADQAASPKSAEAGADLEAARLVAEARRALAQDAGGPS